MEGMTDKQMEVILNRAETDTRAVRKNVSLPAWMAALADKRGINCSVELAPCSACNGLRICNGRPVTLHRLHSQRPLAVSDLQ